MNGTSSVNTDFGLVDLFKSEMYKRENIAESIKYDVIYPT